MGLKSSYIGTIIDIPHKLCDFWEYAYIRNKNYELAIKFHRTNDIYMVDQSRKYRVYQDELDENNGIKTSI